MSRRVRTKMRRQPMQMGLNHHSSYSSSATHFPHSYSIFGSPISIPAKILPLYHHHEINFVFEEAQLLDPDCPIYSLTAADLNSTEEVNLTIPGKITQFHHQLIGIILFICSMACCCLNRIFKTGAFRRLSYTRYSLT